jgi:hypothetical protein
VDGGDEIAKYNLSLGYTNEGGVVKNTQSERYNTLLNANILVTRKIDIFTGVGLSYYRGDLMEQGMYGETNPVLAAYYSMPQLNPYMADDKGQLI